VTRESAAINVVSGHDRPERARGCLLTGEAVAAAAADCAHDRPRLGESSRRVIDRADRPHVPSADGGPAGSPGSAQAREPAGTARQPLSDQERAAIRQAGADDARRSRAEHGFPERIEDPAAVAVLAALLRDARAPPPGERTRRTSTPAA
jgi:hypothetical protein